MAPQLVAVDMTLNEHFMANAQPPYPIYPKNYFAEEKLGYSTPNKDKESQLSHSLLVSTQSPFLK